MYSSMPGLAAAAAGHRRELLADAADFRLARLARAATRRASAAARDGSGSSGRPQRQADEPRWHWPRPRRGAA
jgi:hypothetical protein